MGLARSVTMGFMATEWYVPAITGLVGLAGIAGTYGGVRAQRRTQLETTRLQHEHDLAKLVSAERKAAYLRFLSSLHKFIDGMLPVFSGSVPGPETVRSLAELGSPVEEASFEVSLVGSPQVSISTHMAAVRVSQLRALMHIILADPAHAASKGLDTDEVHRVFDEIVFSLSEVSGVMRIEFDSTATSDETVKFLETMREYRKKMNSRVADSTSVAAPPVKSGDST